MEGSSLVLEKNDSEDCCGDQEERSGDIVSIPCDIVIFLAYIVTMQM